MFSTVLVHSCLLVVWNSMPAFPLSPFRGIELGRRILVSTVYEQRMGISYKYRSDAMEPGTLGRTDVLRLVIQYNSIILPG